MLNTYLTNCKDNKILAFQKGKCDVVSLRDAIGFSLTDKDVKFDATLTPSAFRTAYNNYVLAGKIVPFGDSIKDFDETTGDPELASGSNKQSTFLRYDLTKFGFRFENSTCFDNEAFLLANGSYNLILHFNSTDLLTVNSAGDLIGFDINLITKNFKLQSGSEYQGTKFMLELSTEGTNQYQSNKKTLNIDDLGFKLSDFNGVLATAITINNTSVTTSSTNLDVTIVSACSGTPILGLSDEAFYGLVGQSITVASVTDNGSGNYTLTLSASPSAGTIQVALSNGTYFAIEDANGVKYTGKSNVKTVA